VTYPPAAMRRATAARFCELSVAEFERQVAAGRLPGPIFLGKHERWCRAQLEKALLVLAGEDVGQPDIVIGGQRMVA